MFTNESQVAVLTNLLPPYRVPVFNELATHCDLNVFFATNREADRGWDESQALADSKFAFRNLHLPKLKYGHYFIYFPNWRLRELFRSEYLIIGGWDSWAYLFSIFTGRLLRKKIVIFYESTPASHRFNRGPIATVRKLALNSSQAVFVPGSLAQQAVTSMGVPSSTVTTSFNPVDVEWFHANTRNRIESGDKGHTFIYVGQLITRKNLPSLLAAFKAIANPHDRLHIVGRGESLGSLVKLVSALGIENQVLFFGALSGLALADAYKQADTLVLPSTEEVWGLVVNEALACGLHAVITEKCGVAPDVKSMRGVTVCGTDPDELAFAMQESRATFKGQIISPEILKYTPQKFAQDLIDCLKSV